MSLVFAFVGFQGVAALYLFFFHRNAFGENAFTELLVNVRQTPLMHSNAFSFLLSVFVDGTPLQRSTRHSPEWNLQIPNFFNGSEHLLNHHFVKRVWPSCTSNTLQ